MCNMWLVRFQTLLTLQNPPLSTFELARTPWWNHWRMPFVPHTMLIYYVTKYQTKPQQSLTPLLEVFAGAVRRFHLEQEEAKNEVTNAGQNPDSSKAQHIASIQDPNRQKAQRLLVKMSTAMNKCYWHSLCEISSALIMHLLTNGGRPSDSCYSDSFCSSRHLLHVCLQRKTHVFLQIPMLMMEQPLK